MLPHVVRFNGIEFDELYHELVASVDSTRLSDGNNSSDCLAIFLTQLIQTAGLKTRLSELNVDADRLEELSVAASQQWTGNFNPRPVDQDSLLQLYRQSV